MIPPKLSKILPKPSTTRQFWRVLATQIDRKIQQKNASFWKSIFSIIFLNFDLEICIFFARFSICFSIQIENSDFVKIELSPRREDDF